MLPDPDAIDPAASAEHNEAKAAARAALSEAMASMPDDAATALLLRHGLVDGKYKTCQEVADALNTTPARIYALLRAAKRHIQARPAAPERS